MTYTRPIDPCDTCAQCFAPSRRLPCPRTGQLLRMPDRLVTPAPANDNHEAHNALGAMFASHWAGV